MNNSLNEKRLLFCCNYVKLGNVKESAIKAGFSPETALMEGLECLKRDKFQRVISQLREISSVNGEGIMSGLERLAFGSCNDAVYLVFSEELPPADVISGLDLFNVSEVKRVKGGGVEVKFFDRQKALEKLLEYLNTVDNSKNAASLLQALAGSDSESENNGN